MSLHRNMAIVTRHVMVCLLELVKGQRSIKRCFGREKGLPLASLFHKEEMVTSSCLPYLYCGLYLGCRPRERCCYLFCLYHSTALKSNHLI